MLNNLIQHAMMGYQNSQLGTGNGQLTHPAAGETSLLLVGKRGFLAAHTLSDLVSSLEIDRVLDAQNFVEAMTHMQEDQPAWIVFDADMARTRSASEIAAFVGAMCGAVMVGICRDASIPMCSMYDVADGFPQLAMVKL